MGTTACTVFPPGDQDDTWDAGDYNTWILEGRIWNDRDEDGIQDAGDSDANPTTGRITNISFLADVLSEDVGLYEGQTGYVSVILVPNQQRAVASDEAGGFHRRRPDGAFRE